jgi:hypothetical protein
MTGATHNHSVAGAAGDRAMTAPVPVLVITGPVGVGKSTIAAEAAWLLRLHDLEAIAEGFGAAVEQAPWGPGVQLRDPDDNRLRIGPPAS